MKISEIFSLAALGTHSAGGTVRQIEGIARDATNGRCAMGLLGDCEKAGLLSCALTDEFCRWHTTKSHHLAPGRPQWSVPYANDNGKTFAEFARDAAEFEAERGEDIK